MILLLKDLLVTQAPDAGLPPAAWLLGLLALGAAAVAAVVWSHARGVSRTLAGVQTRMQALEGEHKALAEKERERAKDLEAKREEITKLKKDMAAQRKKTHASQEEAKQLRDDLTSQRGATERARNSRPAFAEGEAPAPAPARPAAKPESAPATAAPPTAGADSSALEELRQRLGKLEERHAAQQQELDGAQAELTKNRNELRGARRKVEDYRRIDTVTAGKMAALEDRVAHLGRQYYEACTEIAVLRGEVPRVPTPQEREAMRSLQEAQHDEAHEPHDEAHEAHGEPHDEAHAEPHDEAHDEAHEPALQGAGGGQGQDRDEGAAGSEAAGAAQRAGAGDLTSSRPDAPDASTTDGPAGGRRDGLALG